MTRPRYITSIEEKYDLKLRYWASKSRWQIVAVHHITSEYHDYEGASTEGVKQAVQDFLIKNHIKPKF